MKKIRLVWVSACFAIMLMDNANAYIDPSVMTYTIQVVAGVVVAVGAVAGVYWRKAKRAIQEKLGLDSDANKVIEDDVVEYAVED